MYGGEGRWVGSKPQVCDESTVTKWRDSIMGKRLYNATRKCETERGGEGKEVMAKNRTVLPTYVSMG